MNPKDIRRNILSLYGISDDLEKGKKKYNLGDIITLGGKKYIVIQDPKNPSKVKYQYYGQGKGNKAMEAASSFSTTKAPKGKVDKYGYSEVKFLGGSNGATLVMKGGKKYVRKIGKTISHAQNEAEALKMYEKFGVPVPKFKIFDNHIYTEFIEGRTLKEVLKKDSPTKVKAVKKKIQEHFVVDCLMANWDVIGADMDNIIVTDAGIPYRVDVGGALNYRAQGGVKESFKNTDKFEEFKLMRDKYKNPSAYSIFGELSEVDIAFQMTDDLLAKLAGANFSSSEIITKRWHTASKIVFGDDTKLKDSKQAKEVESTASIDTTKIDFFKNISYHLKNLKESVNLTHEHHLEINRIFGELNKALSITKEDIDLYEQHFDHWDYAIKHNPSIVAFAKANNMTPIEAYAIHEYTGLAYGLINTYLSDLVKGAKNENIDFTDLEHLKKVKIEKKTSKHGVIAKLVSRGLYKAFNTPGSKDVTPYNVSCYRNFGTNADSEKMAKIFKKGSIIAQCRLSSKSVNVKNNTGARGCRMKYTDKALMIQSISKHETEQEVLFPPFMPIRIELSEIVPDFIGRPTLKVIGTSVKDDFF